MLRDILYLTDLKRLSSRASHSAFTDLQAFRQQLFCCYRQATDHVSGDGRIEICRMSATGRVLDRQHLSLPGRDLRDPKLSVDSQGKMWLIALNKRSDSDKSKRPTAMVSWFSSDGRSWSSAHFFGPKFWWIWRIQWHQGQAYGLGYHRPSDRVDWFCGHPGRQMQVVKSHALSLKYQRLGYPNESALHFDDDSTVWALVRRDADTFSAQFGSSLPPYQRWQWRDLGEYVGGPAMIALDGNHFLVAGRAWTGKALYTRLWLVNRQNGQLQELLTLPSSGDTSYPGLHRSGDTLYVSYYSQHQDNQARVYLACVRGIEQLSDVIKQR